MRRAGQPRRLSYPKGVLLNEAGPEEFRAFLGRNGDRKIRGRAGDGDAADVRPDGKVGAGLDVEFLAGLAVDVHGVGAVGEGRGSVEGRRVLADRGATANEDAIENGVGSGDVLDRDAYFSFEVPNQIFALAEVTHALMIEDISMIVGEKDILNAAPVPIHEVKRHRM